MQFIQATNAYGKNTEEPFRRYENRNNNYIHCHSDQQTTMGCKMIALKQTETDRLMTGIDMICFI